MQKMSKEEFTRKTIGIQQTKRNNFLKIKQSPADEFLILNAIKSIRVNQRNGLYKRC